MRKLPVTLAAAALTASLGAFAAIPTDAAPFQLVVPNLKSGFDITLEGLLLQPTNSDLDYATSSATGVFVTGGRGRDDDDGSIIDVDMRSRVHSVNPRYRLGFRVGLGYTFADSGNDVQLAWTHFRQSNNDQFRLEDDSTFTTRNGIPFFAGHIEHRNPNGVGLPVPRDFDTDLDAGARSSVQTRMDAIDLDVGQYVDVGTRLRLRMFAGLRYADVRSNMSNEYFQSEVTTVGGDEDEDDVVSTTFTGLNEQFNSRFRGIGPRFGVDSVYHLGSCFGVVGRAAVGLLAGRVDSSSNLRLDSVTQDFEGRGRDREETTTFVDVDGNLSSRSSARVVPVLDGKLGLNYTYIFENQSLLTIEAGYQATQYIDAVDRINTFVDIPDDEVRTQSTNNNGVVFVPVASQRVTSGQGFNGPYLNLNWKM